ncbi:MAG: hypothetical protein R6V28_09455 [Nitriliruptoraceae bacterium]
MPARPDEPTRPDGLDGLDGLQGPVDDDLVLSGPGDDGATGADGRHLADGSLPGGLDHTTAAVGAGGVGVALLGLAGVLKRRRDRRRRASLDE